jgi:hypothetical protein
MAVNLEFNQIYELDSALYLIERKTKLAVYDFNFHAFFPAKSSIKPTFEKQAIARIGAIEDYSELYSEALKEGLKLINNESEHLMASELNYWYPLISEFTPFSLCYDQFPSIDEVESAFGWPVFIKGVRQTSRHNASKAIANNPAEYQALITQYKDDPILKWQKIAIRKFIELRKVTNQQLQTKVIPSFEFRSFWLHGNLVGVGSYWHEFANYTWSPSEEREGLGLAQKVASLVNVPFVVIDLAMTANGKWMVIECNDAQESGYAGVSPLGLWNKIINTLRSKLTAE